MKQSLVLRLRLESICWNTTSKRKSHQCTTQCMMLSNMLYICQFLLSLYFPCFNFSPSRLTNSFIFPTGNSSSNMLIVSQNNLKPSYTNKWLGSYKHKVRVWNRIEQSFLKSTVRLLLHSILFISICRLLFSCCTRFSFTG